MYQKSEGSTFGGKVSIVLFLAMFFIAGNIFAVTHTETFNSSDLELSVNERGYDEVRISDLYYTYEIGAPQLLVKYVNLIIPQGMDVNNVNITAEQEVVEGRYMITPAQPPIKTDGSSSPPFVPPDSVIYNSDDPYPSEVVEVINHGYFDGANRIVTLAIYLLQYIPADSTLIFYNYISFSLDFTASSDKIIYPAARSRKNVEVYRNLLYNIVNNPEDIEMYGHTPPILDNPREDDYDYVIIGSEELLPYFYDFMEWKSKKGLRIHTKSIEEIITEYPDGDQITGLGIDDDAGSIRQYLYENYDEDYTYYSLSYVLLVGDETNFPIRYGTGATNNSSPNYQIPADIYFAEFTGDWNVDDDDLYGEPTEDNPDYHQEIFVGRVIIPTVADGGAEEIATWTEKLIGYEVNPGYGDTEYLIRVYFEGADIGATPRHITEYLDPLKELLENQGFTVDRTFEEPPYGPLGTPTGSQVISEMNMGYGIASSHAHGGKSQHIVASTSNGDCPRYSVWGLDEYGAAEPIVEDNNGLDNLSEDSRYFIFYSVGCDNAKFDEEPNYIACIARAFTSYNGVKGKAGPAYLGNTRTGFFNSSALLYNHFLNTLFGLNDEYPDYPCYNIGVAEAGSKSVLSLPSYHYINYSHNLFGDPEMPVWTEIPSYLEVSHNYEEYSVTVSSDGVPVDYALVFFENSETGETELDTTGISGIPGYAQCSFDFNEITITKHNYIPYITHIALNGEIWSGETDVKWLTVVPSGRTLNISGTLNLLELGGKNAKVVVEEGGTLNINANAIITGNKSTYYPDESSPIQVIIPGNCLEVYGDILIGENVIFTAPEGVSWDGLYLLNADAEVTMDNITFERCKLRNESYTLILNNSEFIDSRIDQYGNKVYISETNFNSSMVYCYYRKSKIPLPDDVEINISDCYFSNYIDYPVYISGYDLYNLDGNTISGCNGGFYIFESGHPVMCTISNNIIENNTYGNGIVLYHSYADILYHNIIKENSVGIVGVQNSTITIIGNRHYQYQTIKDNRFEEMVVDFTSFPKKGEMYYNKIIDDDIAGSSDQYLIRCANYTGDPRDLIVEENYWGPESHYWTEWTGDDRFNPSDAFDYIPVWDPGTTRSPGGSPPEQLFAEADSLIGEENYEQAKLVYKNIILLYPESDFAIYSMRNLLPLETVSGQNFTSLKGYYLTDPNCNYNAERIKLSEYLANHCNIKLENYPDAISFFEDIILNTETELDSVYAVIDAGYTYLLMEGGGKSSYIGKIAELKPKSVIEFEETRDKLLAKALGLPDTDEEENIPENIFYLSQNYPNPMRSSTTISFSLPDGIEKARIKIYNIKGQLVKTFPTLNSKSQIATIIWDGRDDNSKQLTNGIYLYKLSAGRKSITKKMLLMR